MKISLLCNKSSIRSFEPVKPWVTLTPTRETHDPSLWVGVFTGRVGVGLVDPRVTHDHP
jgi:hypothetical protein